MSPFFTAQIVNVQFVMQVVEKTKDSESTLRFGALQGILKESHSLFTMFHGPIRALLDRQPSAELARGHLHTFVTDYLSGKFSIMVIIIASTYCTMY
jgi:hypothetical protein